MPGGHPCTVCYDHFLHSRESLSHLIRQPRRALLNLVKHYPMMHHSVLHAQFGIKPLLKFFVVHIINHNPCTTQNHCCYFLNTITDAKLQCIQLHTYPHPVCHFTSRMRRRKHCRRASSQRGRKSTMQTPCR